MRKLNQFDQKDLNPQQQSAVEAPNKPLLIVAGAGTGKTRTLTSRLIYLIEKGVRADKICALTFTNKAAREMLLRIEKPLAQSPRPLISTFHSLGAKILREEAGLLERNSRFVIFDDQDSIGLLRKIVKAAGIKNPDLGPAYFSQKISEIKNGKIALNELRKSESPEDKTIVQVFRRYESDLAKNNAFDFDDLIEKVVKIFKSHPVVLQEYERRFPYLLIDEYQDLNNKQYELVKLLAGKIGNLSVVGDDQQMIYGWRYANLDIFLNFERDWPGSRVALLEENYRSTQNIITAASTLIQNNKYQKPKNLWTKNQKGGPIKISEAGSEEEEAALVIEQIRNSKLEIRNYTTAILYRTNAQSRPIEQALLEENIPYQIFGGVRFYERREIKDVLAALRLTLNPEEEISRDRLAKTFSRTKFSELRENLLRRTDLSPLKLIQFFIKASDYFGYLEKNFINAAERKENIAELMTFASKFGDLSAFLEQVSLLQPTDVIVSSKAQRASNKKQSAISPSQYAVNLMTIHLAKGLEFDQVFVIGCSEGLLPHARSLKDETELEEERRLMYVAMTRAKKELHLSFYDIPSRFISELPQELIRFESLISEEKVFSDSEERYITLD
ncbi:MAG: UvrD-helicase domain-containing protein [Candidatus Liptonbacteria bacterium]|nr:UvrD-helicase domain-containing protein [Candidatus Liptonbacteria bacterium]